MAGPISIFPDTNVLIQGRSLQSLPWEEIGRADIEVIICGPVIRELDRLKNRGGRAGRVAREMSSTVRKLMATADKSDVLRSADPRVTRRLSLGRAVRGPVRPDIDVTHEDQAIINQALALLDAGGDVLLLSDDNFAVMTADEFGLPSMLLPAHWLKEPEADDSAKEMKRRDAEIARLKSQEPAPHLRFTDASGIPLDRLDVTMRRFLPLSTIAVDELMSRVEAVAPTSDIRVSPVPPATTAQSGTTFDLAQLAIPPGAPMPVTPDMVDRYLALRSAWLSEVRQRLDRLHHQYNARRDWPVIGLAAANAGTRNATDVILEVEASGPFQLCGIAPKKTDGDRPDRLALDMPPPPPRERPHSFDAVHNLFGRRGLLDDLPPAPFVHRTDLLRQDDAFYWRTGRDHPADIVSLECRAWRHGRPEDSFAFHVQGGDVPAVAGLVRASVHASNLSQAVEALMPIRIAFEDVDLSAAADLMVSQLEERVIRRDGPPPA